MSAPSLRRRTGEVVANRPVGAYRQLSVVVPTLPGRARPGQFLLAASASPDEVLARTWWLSGEQTEPGFGSTLEVVVADDVLLPGPGEQLALTGPVGRGFGVPTSPVPAVVLTQGAAAGAARWLAERLQAAGCPVHLVSAASDPEEHLDLVRVRRVADGVLLTDREGLAASTRSLAQSVQPAVLYAVGPLWLSAQVAALAGELGVVSQVMTLELGAPGICGHGLCGACDLPLAADRAGSRVRPCLEGPVLRADLVAWEAC